tara:strand:- start:130 stop:348 length:219 start_codon:yes stop_codon:yes gene_type:complete
LWEFWLVFGIVKRENLLKRKKTNIVEFSQFAELKIFEEYLFKIHIFGKHKKIGKNKKITLANTVYGKLLYLV